MCFSGIGLRPAWVSLAFEFLWNGKRMVLAGAMHGFLWHATSRWHSPTRGQDGQWMLVAGEIMNPNLLISSLIKCMFLKDLKVVFWYIFDTVSRLTRRDSHLSLQLICTPVDLWKLGLGAPGLLVSFAQTREEEIASTLRTNRISETWHDNKKARASQHHKTLGILPAHPCSSWLRQRCTCQVDIDRYYKQRLG